MGYEELWDGFDSIVQKTEEGEKFSKELLRYLQKRQEIESNYAKQLTSLVEKLKGDEIGTLGESWESLKEQTLQIANSRNMFCEELETVCTQFSDIMKVEKKTRADLVNKGSKFVKELNKADDTMKNCRKSYVTSRQKQEKSVLAYEQGKQQASSSVGKLQKTADKDTKKADKSDKEYEASVSTLCGVQDKFYDTDMPALMSEFQQFDIERIQTTKSILNDFSTVQKKLGPSMIEACKNMEDSFSHIKGDADTQLYTDQNRSSNTRPHAEYTSWEGEIKEVLATPVTNSAPEKVKKPKPEKNKEPKPDKMKKSGSANPTPPNKAPPGPPPPGDLPPPPPPPPGDLPPPAPTFGNAPRSTPAPSPSAVPAASAPTDEYIALYTYEAQDDDEISFYEGEIIALLEKDDSGWWVGQNPRGEVGSFPSNYVEVALEEGEITEINANYRALYDYPAEDETELTIKQGDILFVFTETDGWYFGSNAAGEQGNFPSNYMEAC